MKNPSRALLGARERASPRLRNLGAALLLMLPLGVFSAFAQEAPRVPVDQSMTQQKAELLNRLVTRSVAAQKISESGDPNAIAELESARQLVRQAEIDLKTGNHVAANEKLDAALALVNRETRRLSEDQTAAASAQRTYDRRLRTVRTFLAAYERVAGEKKAAATMTEQIRHIKRLVDEADSLAAEGDVQRGVDRLDQAYLIARGDIRELREGETLTRSLDFATPEAEYDYEKNRNDSHIMLLKFALSEHQPSGERVAAIEKLRSQAMTHRSAGEKLAGSGDFPSAIKELVRSTDGLLKAIRISGIYIPG